MKSNCLFNRQAHSINKGPPFLEMENFKKDNVVLESYPLISFKDRPWILQLCIILNPCRKAYFAKH